MAEKTLQAIDAAKTYLFAGPQLEELLLEVAGAASTAALAREGDVEVSPGEFEQAIVVAINVWALDRPERFALAHQRADDLGVPQGLMESAINALLDLILIPAEEVPLTPEGKVERGEKIVAAARLLRDLTPQRGGAAAPEPDIEQVCKCGHALLAHHDGETTECRYLVNPDQTICSCQRFEAR